MYLPFFTNFAYFVLFVYQVFGYKLCLQSVHVNYFWSFTKDAGFEMVVSSGSFGANHEVDVQTVHDDLQLTRRPVSK